jgi:chromate transporter
MSSDTQHDWKIWLRIGLLSFGGPAGQIALMHRELVEQRQWINERDFTCGLSFCMLLPGPEAQQLATYIGWRRGGWLQAVLAGTLFFLPGALLIVALCSAYVAARDVGWVQVALLGVQCAVLSIVLEALLRVGRRALIGPASVCIAVAAFLLVSFRALPFPAVLLVAALAGMLMHGGKPDLFPSAVAVMPSRTASASYRPAAIALLLWLLPVGLLCIALGQSHVLSRIALLFSELALVTFGGAYAVLAYVTEQAVQVEGWLSTAQMMDGLGLAETTPGPLILVLQFVAFLAGYQSTVDAPSWWLGLAASGVALWVLFLPSFVWIFAAADHVDRWASNPRARAALQGITAAVLGVIAHVAVWFAMHLLFAETTVWRVAGLETPLPASQSLRTSALLPALAAAVTLFALHRGVLACLSVAALVALVQSLAGIG